MDGLAAGRHLFPPRCGGPVPAGWRRRSQGLGPVVLLLLLAAPPAAAAAALVRSRPRSSRPSRRPHRGGRKHAPQWVRGTSESDREREPEPPRLPLGTILGRLVDTAEDAFVHLKRVPYDYWGWLPPAGADAGTGSATAATAADRRRTVLVLGSGWAAHALVKVADPLRLRLLLASPTNHFAFTPMLAAASVGSVEYRSMTEAIRAANPLLDLYLEGAAVDLDPARRTVTVQLPADPVADPSPPLSPSSTASPGAAAGRNVTLRYDTLVVAVGSRAQDAAVPGAAAHCLRLKSCEDARRLRTAIGRAFEHASRPDVVPSAAYDAADDDAVPSLPEPERRRRAAERRRRVTFCIVGGGPTGCELAGELSDFCRDVTKPRTGVYSRLRDDVRIVLVHGGGELVPQFDPDLRGHAVKSLQQQGVDVKLNTYVEECGDGFIRLKDKFTGEQAILLNGLTIWAAGVGPVPFVETLLSKLPEAAKGPNGRVLVDKWMRCPVPPGVELGSILVLGDAAAFAEDHLKGYLPQTAQVAGQQGAFAARLLDRGYDLSVTPPTLWKDDASPMSMWLKARGIEQATGFDFLNLGLLAYVGGNEALSQIEIGDVPILSYAGSISFVLWRSVYLVKQVATRNRVLVTFDWIKTFLFGRDVTRL